jgi:uroporphyrinogen-III synthase
VGAIPIIFPTIQIAPLMDNTQLDAALGRLKDYDWVVFTSANGVRVVCDRLQTLGQPLSVLGTRQIAVIGPVTAATLASYGLNAALQPTEYIAESIFEAISQRASIPGKRFLLLRADIARATLCQQLIAAGASADEIPVYRTVRAEPDPTAYAQLRSGVDIITFTSSSTVRFFFELLGAEADRIAANAVIACIGPITAQTARSLGLNVSIVAEEYTITGLMAALAEG